MSNTGSPDTADQFSADERLLHAIVDTSGSVILALRPDHTIFAWNRAAEVVYQTPRETAIGLDYVAVFLAPEHRDAVAADIREVLAGKRTLNFEDDSILPDGSRRTLIWNVTRILDSANVPLGILAIGQDITERKVVEERFRLVFEHAQDGLLLSDEAGIVVDCNPAALELLGLTERTQLIGRRPAELSPLYQRDGTLSAVKSKDLGARTRELGEMTFEWLHQRPDGTTITLEVSVRHAKIGARQMSVVRWHDLTRREELERQRHEVQMRLQQAQKFEAVAQLAGGVAHDFNNLLSAMRNAVELARGQLDATHPAQADLTLAFDTSARAAGLTRQLLAFSRQHPVAVERIDLVVVVRESLSLLRSLMPANVATRVTLPDVAMFIDADRSQLDQVLLNLVINARDAMPNGGLLTLTLERCSAGTHALLTLRDTGVGMDAATKARVFEPFFTTKPVGVGTGLGLAVAHGIVSQAGGTITIESAIGAGAAMIISLPLSQRAAPVRMLETTRAERTSSLCLLVDDDDAVRSTTRRLLERQGWKVLEADDGAVALQLFEADPSRIGVILTDVRMPKLDGVQLARRVRELSPDMPIVFMSGFDRLEDPGSGAVLDVPLLLKPFTAAELERILSRAVR